MDPSLRLVTERFDQVGGPAAWLFERDENFRDLCEEYAMCVRTVARFATGEASSEQLRNEYAALLLRLEHELLRYLEEHPHQG